MTKPCRLCGVTKELEQFPKEPRNRDGRRHQCIDCRKAYHNQNYQKYYSEHKEDKKAKVTVYYESHKEERKLAKKLYNSQPHRLESERLRNAERRADKSGHPHRAFLVRKYLARKLNAPGHATKQQLAARWQYYGNRCWMCNNTATETDHVKPLSKGGSNWPANLRPVCRSCNARKSNIWPITSVVV